MLKNIGSQKERESTKRTVGDNNKSPARPLASCVERECEEKEYGANDGGYNRQGVLASERPRRENSNGGAECHGATKRAAGKPN